jgi:branched-chain amino acid transport system permease protein
VLDHLINGIALGNIYALIAIGFALIFGVANLINFAHGSVFTWGAYIGWTLIVVLGWPWYVALGVAAVGCGLIGMAIERLALRPLAGGPPIAPLLSTVALSVVLDQTVERPLDGRSTLAAGPGAGRRLQSGGRADRPA